MSGKLVGWAMEQETGSSTAKLILVKLADNANEHGVCWPSIELVVRHTELSERAVRKHLYELERLGLLRIERRESDGVKLRNIYHLLIGGGGIAPRAIPLHSVPGGTARRAAGVVHEVQEVLHHVHIHKEEPSSKPSIEPSSEPCAFAALGVALIEVAEEIKAGKKAKKPQAYTAGFERVWIECRKWPGFAPGMSKDDAFKAYTQAADVRPPDGDLVAAAREHGRWLASENAARAKRRENPHPTIHPATWLRQHRWKGYLEQMALEVAEGEMPRRITLAPEHVEALRNAGLSEAIVASWFADGEVRGNPPVFIAPSSLKQQWIERHYMRELARAFGANVTVTVKQERKVA